MSSLNSDAAIRLANAELAVYDTMVEAEVRGEVYTVAQWSSIGMRLRAILPHLDGECWAFVDARANDARSRAVYIQQRALVVARGSAVLS